MKKFFGILFIASIIFAAHSLVRFGGVAFAPIPITLSIFLTYSGIPPLWLIGAGFIAELLSSVQVGILFVVMLLPIVIRYLTLAKAPPGLSIRFLTILILTVFLQYCVLVIPGVTQFGFSSLPLPWVLLSFFGSVSISYIISILWHEFIPS